jgi:hypothetical protein
MIRQLMTYLRQHRINRHRLHIVNSGWSGRKSAILGGPGHNRGGERRPVRFQICRRLVNRARSLNHRPSARFILEQKVRHTWV